MLGYVSDTAWAMSEENVEIVRRGWEGFTAGLARGDPSGGAYESGAFAPDCEWLTPAEFPGPRSYVGQEGFAEFMRLWTEDFDQFELRLERLVDAGDDRVVGLFHHTAVGKGSGAPVELHQGLVYELEGGRVIRCLNYGDHGSALEAADLLSAEGSHVVARSLEPDSAWGAVQLGFAEILDLRTEIERRRHGAPPGARPVSLAKHILSPEGPGSIYLCQHAIRSKATLRRGAAEVAGGFAAWKEAGLPVEEVT